MATRKSSSNKPKTSPSNGSESVKKARTKAAPAPVPAPEPISATAVADGGTVEISNGAQHENGLQDEVARLAYGYFEARGCAPGDPLQDWVRAEQEVRARRKAMGAAAG